MIKSYFSKSLSTLIALAKITKKSLASAIGLTGATVTQMSNGSSLPSVEKLVEIADYFDVSLDFLVARKAFKEPEGILPYIFKAADQIFQGNIKYVFGIVPVGDYQGRKFIYLEDDGDFINQVIDSHAQFEFITLAYFLNNQLYIGYDAFKNNGIDLIMEYNGEYQEIAIEYGAYSARFGYVGYADYLKQWISLPIEEKIKVLKNE